MSVGSGVPYNPHTGNGLTTVFAYGFTLLDADDLVVTIDGVVTSAYTVSGLGVAAGGSITFSSAPANGAAVLLQRVIQLVRSTEYPTNGDLLAETVNGDFDRLWMAIQNVDADSTRSLRVPEVGVLPELPAAADRADKLLSFDSDGNPSVTAPSAGTATALAADLLDSSTATKGPAMVGMGPSVAYENGPRVANYLKSYVTPLAYTGCVGDGVADDSSYVAAALAAGKREIVIPGGYTFLVDGLLTVPTGVRIVGEGKLKKKSGTVRHILVIADNAEDVKIEGITIDGNRSAYSTGNAVSAIAAYLAQGLTFEDVKLYNIIDCGLKLFNCGYVEVRGGRWYNIGENGIEFKNYDVDPRTGLAYATALPALQGGHRVKGVWMGKIDNETGDGSGDGCGILVSAGLLAAGTAYPVKGVTISDSHFLNVKRGVWAENNDAGCETEDMSVIGNWFRGDIAGFGGDVKDGIGAINVKRFKAQNNIITNVGNMDVAYPATSCAGIQVSGGFTEDVELLDNRITDNTGATHRMDLAINIAAGARITTVNNTTIGGSEGTINVASASVSELVCHSNPYATGTYSWSETITVQFTVSNILATENRSMLPVGFADDPELVFPMPVRLVGMAVKMSNSPSTGTITFKPYTNGVNRSSLNATNGDFSSTIAVKAISTNNGVTIAAGEHVRVYAETSGYGATTHDAIVTLTFETSFKE